MARKDAKETLYNAFREIAEKTPIDKITVIQIAEKAGLTPQTFYNYFPDKYELVLWGYKRRVDRLFVEFVSDEISWREVLRQYIKGYKENASYIINALNNTSGEDSYLSKSARYLAETMELTLCKKRGVDELPEDIKLIVRMYVSGIVNVIAQWLMNKTYLNEDEITDVLTNGISMKLYNYYVGID